MSNQSIAVVGGGITGLAAAHHLASENRRVRLFEASGQLGGSIRSERTPEGWLIETGPNTVLDKTNEFKRYLDIPGLAQSRLRPDPLAKKRFIVRNGKLMALPTSAFGAATTRIVSFNLKWRIARDFFFSRPRNRTEDLPLSELAREHYGDEFIDYALNPMVAGIYAGDPEKLSARHAMPFIWDAERSHGSIVRGQIAQMRARRKAGIPKAEMLSFQNGLQELPDALAAQLPNSALETGARIESISRCESSGASEPRWLVRWMRDGAAQTETFSKVLLAIPPHALAPLQIAPDAARPGEFFAPLAGLGEIASPPLASLFLGYKREQIAHPLDGFGALVPEVEKLPFLGVLFSSSLFAGRTPPGHAALTVMIGGTRQPGLASLGEQQLVDLVSPPLGKLLGIQGAPVFQKLTTHQRAIPQYNVGHEKYLSLIDEFERAHPGLVVAGNVRDGIAVPACVASGVKRAGTVM
ncbi:oxygen-dependent protoporphyrinogen oxidase [Ereboglobus sp. PH5-10]|uniref:protoporphyrinogen oxidase n=1 Tax=Ereboglobus sp. PH5-10 TaxID=2940629 RepID=UPI00240560CE|nr:protoporphyrinogen oxidase [Ereboglobus sp. PH5-10]MDF9826721.1 oxygen-dependent protoporphyrinogen oxidase [Ereboglobus sp. PH5-10]